MTIKEYQIQAKRTCPSLGNDKLDLAHMVLGIGSETEELYKAMLTNDSVNVLEEIIDKIWYIANYCTFRGYSLEELYNKRDSFTDEPWEANTEVEVIKFSKYNNLSFKYICKVLKTNTDSLLYFSIMLSTIVSIISCIHLSSASI